MSKKHFIALADTIIEANRYNPGTFDHRAILALANFCRRQNYDFNEDRWLDYINGDCTANGKRIKRETATA